MDLADVDWKNIDSLFVEDELYEQINAPKWVDFAAPDEFVEDDTWFCRPDCQHPKHTNDFLEKQLKSDMSPENLPLGEKNRREGNLKRRGVSSTVRSKQEYDKISCEKLRIKHKKKFRDNDENENPNTASSAVAAPASSPAKGLKQSIDCSAEKMNQTQKNGELGQNQILQSHLEQYPPQRLRSTLSTRNLFAGREILNHITEFCNDLRRLAFPGRDGGRLDRSKEKKSLISETEETFNSGTEESIEKPTNSRIISDHPTVSTPDSRRQKMIDINVENKQISPPVPQRFSPPSGHQKSSYKLRITGKGRRGIAEDDRQTNVAANGREVCSEQTRPTDFLWFFKPCTA